MFSAEKIMIGTGHSPDREWALQMAQCRGADIVSLMALANRVREANRGIRVDLCSIINARSGACPEDCSFCAQSAHSSTRAETYPLVNRGNIISAAREARQRGVKRFCIVTSGKKPSAKDMDEICSCITDVRKEGLLPCATLGMLGHEELKRLQDAGLHRYHHNLETSEAFFSEICTTHTYRDKIKTIEAARALGLSLCSGGIFGLGETWEDRIDMAFALKELGIDSVPVNFFTPIEGTPLGNRDLLEPLEALKIIALYRLILPDREVRVCGGRPGTLRDLQSHIFSAGADGLLIGNYLTTPGRNPEEDIRMIRDMGMEL
ncbi:MAG: biotin synthase BioB [Nitrospiraceae bacterium]|nr:MAG: biotin synthase BioB [Nitrospiraceae bacterium]